MNDSKNFNNDFSNNEIYQHLTSRNATSLVSIIDTTYRNCEYILGMIPKEFSNYTLHDIHHSIRVINYMTQFVKKDLDKYSDFHLALILIVGLLHDTGMLVSDEEKKQIISNEIKADSCPEKIQDQFQTYIRDRHSQRVVKTLSTYVIDKDSGAVFSSVFRLETYNFTDDILLICQSHTESIDWIRTNISESAELTHYEYNPQQIAMLLKIADNLDIDDRRAPYSLLNSLKIKGYSETEWLKHIPISNYEKVIFKNGAFIIKFNGKCEDPFIFRKVMDHISWLNKTCSEINNITSNYIEPYQFQINDKFSIDIKTKGFEAINLNFAIDYTSVLDLLMGENLYGKRSAGLRELIQNSIDAVMVMREKTSSKPLSSYKPSICIEMNRANNSIIVHDNGIGMDMHVLNNYFFNVGKSYYTSKEYLEEHLKYSAIGHFGIGFLACFMLSKKVLLETKSIKSDPITLEFEDKSSCVTKISNNECIFEEGHGTRIHLTYNDVIPSVFENEDALINYVESIVLADDYELKIITSENTKSVISNNLCKSNRHLSTPNFDVYYTLSRTPKIWHDLRDVLKNNSPLYFIMPFEDYQDEFIDVASLIYTVEELEENWTTEELKRDLDDKLGKTFCTDNNIKYLLGLLSQKTDNEHSLSDILNDYLIDYIYHEGHINITVVDCTMSLNVLDQAGLDVDMDIDFEDIDWDEGMVFKVIEKHDDHSDELYHRIFESLLTGPDSSANFSDLDLDVFRNGLRAIKKNNSILPLYENEYHIESGSVYAHGIRVDEELIRFPEYIYKTSFDNVYVNIKTNEYELDITRKRLKPDSRQKLYREIAKEIYKDIANNMGTYTKEEKALIMKFVNEL